MSVVINRSELEAAQMGSRPSKQPSPPKVEPRTYDDGPLPVSASSHAPRNAVIVNRVFEGGIVTFDLKIGETVFSDVGLNEVLDYVSPHHLEEYENAEFQLEAENIRIAEEDDRRREEEKYLRRKEKAKTKGVIIMQETSADEGESVTEPDIQTGKHGRARPSYKQLFKKTKQRRRRDQKTGELLPFSDEDEVMQKRESSSEDQPGRNPSPDPASLDNLPKRRRRKRDPVTGELMPLAPLQPDVGEVEELSDTGIADEPELEAPSVLSGEKKKRPRRRRHPITQELMPLGWRYDPEAERQQQQSIQVSAIQRLSLSKENEPKRRRLDQTTSPSGRSRSPTVATQSTSKRKGPTTAPLSAFKSGGVITLHDTDSDDSTEEGTAVTPGPTSPKPKLLRRSVGGASIGQGLNTTKQERGTRSPGLANVATLAVRGFPNKPTQTRVRSASSNSSILPLQVDNADSLSEEEEEDEDDTKETKAHTPRKPGDPITSIIHPSAPTEEASSSEDEDEDEDIPENEYVVEAILGHDWSQPSTHPADMGKKPVMLYKVKWEGWTEPTWEPPNSFGDVEVIRQYHQRKGLKMDGISD